MTPIVPLLSGLQMLSVSKYWVHAALCLRLSLSRFCQASSDSPLISRKVTCCDSNYTSLLQLSCFCASLTAHGLVRLSRNGPQTQLTKASPSRGDRATAPIFDDALQ